MITIFLENNEVKRFTTPTYRISIKGSFAIVTNCQDRSQQIFVDKNIREIEVTE